MSNIIVETYKPQLSAPLQCPLCATKHTFKWHLYGLPSSSSAGFIRGWSVCEGRPVLISWKWEIVMDMRLVEKEMLEGTLLDMQALVIRRDIEDLLITP